MDVHLRTSLHLETISHLGTASLHGLKLLRATPWEATALTAEAKLSAEIQNPSHPEYLCG